MTERRTEQVPVPDGSELRLTIASPESVVRGGIVVFHEARGVTTAVQQLAGELAGEGWLAVVPHLYHRYGEESAVESAGELAEDGDPEQVRRRIGRLTADSLRLDVDASLRWLSTQGVSADRIGVMGYGLGGTVALVVATQRDLGAAVTIDGVGVVEPVAPALPAMTQAASELRCPWLGLYSRGGPVPEDEVLKLQVPVHSAQVATDLVQLSDGAPRFGTRSGAAVEAWSRTLNWFDSHLR
ncbi:MAG: dienelactone hydrolase family protein [Pseudonocardiaceae bacterium]